MCGRINVSDSEGVQALMAMLGMPLWRPESPRWNVAPTSILPALIKDALNEPTKVPTELRWGLTPPWAEPGQSHRPLINARSETLFTKPTFKEIAKEHRAIVPVNGFYEWEVQGDQRIPYFVQVLDQPAMLLATVFQPVSPEDIAKEQASKTASPQMGFSFEDDNEEESGPALPSFTGDFAVVTTAATGTMASIHERTPVMLSPDNAARWLDSDDLDEIQSMLVPDAVPKVALRRVSRAVNSIRNDGPECLAPADDD